MAREERDAARQARDKAQGDLTQTQRTLSMAQQERDAAQQARDKAQGDLTQTQRTLSMTEEQRDAAQQAAREAGEPRTLTVRAGETMRLGSSHYVCGEGDDCTLTFAADGTVTQMGGLTVLTAMMPAMDEDGPPTYNLPASANSPMTYTVEAGGTLMLGGADIACPAGDGCQVLVQDGTITSTGGTVTVTMPRMDLMLPAAVDFTLAALTLTIEAGTTARSGRVDFACETSTESDGCTVVVDRNGAVSWSGGAPTVVVARAEVMVEGMVPEGYMGRQYYADDVPAGAGIVAEGETEPAVAPYRWGIFDFTCAGDTPCVVSVDPSGGVSGTVATATVARSVYMLPDDFRPGLEGESLTLAAEYLSIDENGEEVRNDGWVRFSCPDDGDAEVEGTCGVLVDDDGDVFVSGGATASFEGTVFWGEAGMLTPMAASALSITVPTLPEAMVDPTETARTGTITAAAANAHDDGDVLTKATGELPMRAVTVGDPYGTGNVQTYMAGPRSVVVAGTTANTPASEEGTIQRYAAISHSQNRFALWTQDPRQFPTYVLSDADVVSSIELDGDGGVTVKIGSADNQGLAFNDMKTGDAARPAGAGAVPTATATGNDWTGDTLRTWAEENHSDLTIEFGSDAHGEDPHGDGAHYWRADVEFDTSEEGADGVYELWLSNQAGTVSATSASYLEYAAYGLFNFMDKTLADATSEADGDGNTRTYTPASARLQGLHFGFDTPTTGTDSIASLQALAANVGVTYRGRATALAMITTGAEATLQDCSSGTCSDASGSDNMASIRHATESLMRMRGDVALYACFGAHADACTITGAPGGNTPPNEIEGSITNFEALADGVWRDTVSGDDFDIGQVNLSDTHIDANGAYGFGVNEAGNTTDPRGRATVDPGNKWGDQSRGADSTGDHSHRLRWFGSWGGRFYGPATDTDGPAETAGWWTVAADPANDTVHQVVGSFGAKRETP